jgi:hypothetical protein
MGVLIPVNRSRSRPRALHVASPNRVTVAPEIESEGRRRGGERLDGMRARRRLIASDSRR